MATTTGKVALSGICAGIALYIAVRADNERVQAAAALASSCLFGFTATTLVLKQHRERKSREINTETYLEMLRQVNVPRPHTPQQPLACKGCTHYHGRIYGGNMLVCAMHPMGVESDQCSDWESKEGKGDGDRHSDHPFDLERSLEIPSESTSEFDRADTNFNSDSF
jgi:hypothetical protein